LRKDCSIRRLTATRRSLHPGACAAILTTSPRGSDSLGSASEGGEQQIRIIFDKPVSIHQIELRFRDADRLAGPSVVETWVRRLARAYAGRAYVGDDARANRYDF